MYTMHTIAVYNHKGGTAKTSTVHSLAHALARAGDTVLVLDLDPQANLSRWFGLVDASPNLADVIRGKSTLPAAIHKTSEGVDVVPAPTDRTLIAAERELSGTMAPHLWLSRMIRTIPRDRWQWILLDCPPAMGLLSQGAMTASGWVLCPVPPRVLDADGVASLLGFIAEARELINPDLRLLGVLPVAVDRRVGVTGDILTQLGALGTDLMATSIPINSKMAEAPAYQTSIFAHDARSTSARAYSDLAEEVRSRVQA